MKFDDDFVFHTSLVDSRHKNKNTNGAYERDKIISFSSTDKVHLKNDCYDGSVTECARSPMLLIFAQNVGPRHRTIENPRVTYVKKKQKFH